MKIRNNNFVVNPPADGRVVKCLTVVHDATHEAERAIGGHALTRILDQAALTRGQPQAIRTDNGK